MGVEKFWGNTVLLLQESIKYGQIITTCSGAVPDYSKF